MMRKRNVMWLQPVPWYWLCAAARLPGKALLVGSVLWHLVGRRRSLQARWSYKTGEYFGLTRHTTYRGLRALEAAGLVAVERHPGRCPAFTITIPDRYPFESEIADAEETDETEA